MLAFDAKRKRLFVTKQGTGDVTVLDAADGKVVKTLPAGEGALGIGLDPVKERAYVANRQASTITVIDTATLEVLANLAAGSRPNTVTIDAKTHSVYVTNKAKSAGRGAPPIDDPAGDTVTLVRS
jgi:YVTN family beta-propeller protein